MHASVAAMLEIDKMQFYHKAYAKQRYLGCKKAKANQKQQLSEYNYIAIHATKNFDISQL